MLISVRAAYDLNSPRRCLYWERRIADFFQRWLRPPFDFFLCQSCGQKCGPRGAFLNNLSCKSQTGIRPTFSSVSSSSEPTSDPVDDRKSVKSISIRNTTPEILFWLRPKFKMDKNRGRRFRSQANKGNFPYGGRVETVCSTCQEPICRWWGWRRGS